MKELKPDIKNKGLMKQFKAKIAKFSYLPHKELVLLIDIKVLNQRTNKWEVWNRDHVWVNNFVVKKLQGKYVNFIGIEYEYKNNKQIKQIGIEPKMVISIEIRKNKYLILK